MKTVIRDLTNNDVEAVESTYDLYWPEQDFRGHLSERLRGYIDATDAIVQQAFKYLVAEGDSEVVGVIGFRKAPQHMMEFTKTEKPAEIYILAAKHRGVGIGRSLVAKALEEIKNAGYTEVVLFSGETHKESWDFYDNYGFEKVRDTLAPNGEPGYIWRLKINNNEDN